MTNVVVPNKPGMRYRPILALGEGGMAEVHLAVGRGPSGFNKLVVLKAMRRSLPPDAELRTMFLGEARLSARLNHANVVQVYEVVDSTWPCIVMEYLDGQPLSTIYQAGGERFTTAMQLRIIADVLVGLHYSHELCDYDGTPLNIVHRDVSPQNIFVTYDGVVKVLDFGIAKAANAPGQTNTGIIRGKLSYMAPEQVLGEKLDRRVDVYAAGCLLWHATTGSKLWAGLQEREIVRNLVEGKIPRPSSRCPVNWRLEQIVMKALSPDPALRYPTALELQTAVAGYLAETYPILTMREVATFVSQLFTEQRDNRSKTIHSALSAPESVPPAAAGGDASAVRLSALTVPDAARLPAKKTRRRASFAIPLLLALAAAGGYATFRVLLREHAPAASAQVPAPRLVQVRLSVTPPEARITVDGKPLASNPAQLDVPIDQLDHQVRTVASGYAPSARQIRFERDLALELVLEKLGPQLTASTVPSAPAPTVSAGRSAGSQPRSPRPPRTSSPSGKGPGCSPPFYFENGIKVFKPQCI
jgi:eukaryotic-like serine/threonine-protein kinase